jgi:hypothetical protein
VKGETLGLATIAVALLGILIAMLLAPTTPKEHRSNCDTGYSTQIEDGVEKITYIPANDTCKNK